MVTVDERQGLLQAVLDAPDDDALRLIFADWLEEHGEAERAEFIRVQCELAVVHKRLHDLSQSEVEGDYDRWAELRQRESELLEGFALYWLLDAFPAIEPERFEYRQENGRVVGFGGAILTTVAFRRGFVEHVTSTWDDWDTCADAVLACQPVRKVKLTDMPKWGFIDSDMQIAYLRSQRHHCEADTHDIPVGMLIAKFLVEKKWRGITFDLPDDM